MNKEKLFFIGYYFPHEFLEKNIKKFYFVPFASNKLQKNILSSFVSDENLELDILSFLPTTEFPKSKFLYAGGFEKLYLEKNRIRVVPYLNLLLVKHVSKFATLFFVLFILLLKQKGKKSIMIYNLNSVVLLVVRLLRLFFKFKSYVIVADMPIASIPNESVVIKPLRKLDYFLVVSLLKKFSGLIVLSNHLIWDFFPTMNNIVLEGMLPKKLYDLHFNRDIKYREDNTIVFTYVGRLSSYQNVDGLVNAFISCGRKDIRLLICGKGELNEFLQNAAMQDSRIKYYGFVPDNDMLDVINKTDYFVNPKMNDGYFSKYSFPSKIIEYMVTGKPTITFKVAGIPNEYFQYMISLEDNNEALKIFIENVIYGNSEHRKIGYKAKNFIMKNKTTYKQSKRVYNFLYPDHSKSNKISE